MDDKLINVKIGAIWEACSYSSTAFTKNNLLIFKIIYNTEHTINGLVISDTVDGNRPGDIITKSLNYFKQNNVRFIRFESVCKVCEKFKN